MTGATDQIALEWVRASTPDVGSACEAVWPGHETGRWVTRELWDAGWTVRVVEASAAAFAAVNTEIVRWREGGALTGVVETCHVNLAGQGIDPGYILAGPYDVAVLRGPTRNVRDLVAGWPVGPCRVVTGPVVGTDRRWFTAAGFRLVVDVDGWSGWER